MTIYSEPKWQQHTEFDGYDDPRVFIPLSSNGGCPIGCKYCYIPNLGKEPVPIESAAFDELLRKTTEDPQYIQGRTLVSFGCVDDPFYPSLVPNLIKGLSHFASVQQPGQPVIQIASKLMVPEEIFNLSQDWPQNVYAPTVSVSITSIKNAPKIEPNAPSPEDRAKNFDTLQKMGWYSLAMMKPYLPTMPDEVDTFADLYTRHTPDAVVIGSRHKKNSRSNNRRNKPHAVAPDWSRVDNNEEMQDFAAQLQRALAERALGHVPVFDSSVKAAIHFITH